MSENGRGVAVITGGSSGIGAIYADRLARRGYDLVLVARDAARLQDVADAASRATGRSVEILRANLSQSRDLAAIESRLRTDPRVTMLVNSAGFGASTPLLNSNVERMSEMIRVNCDALMRLNYAVTPSFVSRGAGAIVNISSIVAITPETLNGVYGATKAFVLALSLSMHYELAARGVRIQAVLPGAVATDFWSETGTPLSSLPSRIVMPASELVDAAMSGFDQGELVTLPALQDLGAWQAYEDARQAMAPGLSLEQPAPRYRASERV
jgi:short-subunit dehydrogenase